jgi:hypothetical protein
VVKNELVAVDVTDGKKPKELSSLTFGKPGETVRGSVFDVERKVAFAITARAIDPLYAISFADPKALKIESEIDGLSGDISVFTLRRRQSVSDSRSAATRPASCKAIGNRGRAPPRWRSA